MKTNVLRILKCYIKSFLIIQGPHFYIIRLLVAKHWIWDNLVRQGLHYAPCHATSQLPQFSTNLISWISLHFIYTEIPLVIVFLMKTCYLQLMIDGSAVDWNVGSSNTLFCSKFSFMSLAGVIYVSKHLTAVQRKLSVPLFMHAILSLWVSMTTL